MHTFTLEPLGTTPVLQFEATLQLPDAPPIQLVAVPLQAVAALKLKVAVTVLLAFIETMHEPVPVQAPLHPTNVEPAFGAAINVTLVP
jgi:hypothetical protein